MGIRTFAYKMCLWSDLAYQYSFQTYPRRSVPSWNKKYQLKVYFVEACLAGDMCFIFDFAFTVHLLCGSSTFFRQVNHCLCNIFILYSEYVPSSMLRFYRLNNNTIFFSCGIFFKFLNLPFFPFPNFSQILQRSIHIHLSLEKLL